MKHGDKINNFTFPPDSNDGVRGFFETPMQTIHYEEQNLGDHGIGWIIVTRDGHEVNRTNVKYVETIIWKSAL